MKSNYYGRYKPIYDEYEIYINGTNVKTIYGKKSAIKYADKCTDGGTLFNPCKIEVVNTSTGEVEYQIN